MSDDFQASFNIGEESMTDSLGSLQKFLKKFSEEQNPHLKTRELHTFARQYIHCFNRRYENAHVDLFFNIVTQMPKLFEIFMNCCPYSEEENQLKSIGNNERTLYLQSASMCLNTLSSCLEIFKASKQLLPYLNIILNILYQAYTHCKDSELIYGDLLDDFSGQLGSFFNAIQSLQTAALSELDKLNDELDFEQDTNVIWNISVELGKLSMLVTTLDAVMAIKLWKIYIRIIIKHQEILHHQLDVDSVVKFLISDSLDMMKQFKYNLDQNSPQEDEMGIKTCSFQLNIITKILEVFGDYLKESIEKLRVLILELYELLISCCSPMAVDKSNLSLIKNTLLKCIWPFLSHLYANENFFKSVFQPTLEDAEPDFHLSLFLLKLSALPLYEEKVYHMKENILSQDVNFEIRVSIFKNIFQTLQRSKPEDDIKLISIEIPEFIFSQVIVSRNEKAQLLTLYHYAYSVLSSYSKTLPDSYFEVTVKTVLQQLISSSDIISLLISDVLIYRLRCSSVDFLHKQCDVMAQAYFKMESNFKVVNLIKRMLKFLPQQHKEIFLEENGELKAIISDMHIKEFKCGASLCFSPDEKMYTDPYKEIISLMAGLKECSSIDLPHLNHKACLSLVLCSLLVNISKNDELLKFTEFAKHVFQCEIYEVQMTVISFLKSLNKKQILQDEKFEKLLKSLAELIVETLHCENYIVRCEAFNAFVSLAQSTPHVRIIQDIMKLAPDLKPAIKSHITAVPLGGLLSEKEEMENLLKQANNTAKFPQQNNLSNTNNVLLHLFSKVN